MRGRVMVTRNGQAWSIFAGSLLGLGLGAPALGQMPAGEAKPIPNKPVVSTPALVQAPSAPATPERPLILDAVDVRLPATAAEPLAGGQVPTDPGLSSRPPAFTIPDAKGPAPKTDPAAPTVTNDPNAFAGHPSVQDALTALLPGNFKNTRYKWYGFVRLDAIYDFRPIGSTDDFVTATIPIPQGQGRNFVMTPRYTRLGFDTSTPLPSHDWTIKTRIETDFFNGNTSGLFGSFPLRLRFAWIDVGPFLVGQAASLFMDYDVFPNVLDYEGPPGMVLMRQPIAAVRLPVTDNLKVSFGVEQPYSDIQWDDGGFVVNPGTGIITTPGVPKNIQGLPDFTGNIRYTHDYGHCQVAGILRKLEFQSAAEETFIEWGYGVNLTATLHPWAALRGMPKDSEPRDCWQRSRFLGQFACGRGISRYIQDINGFGLDATFDQTNGFRALQAYGWFIAYEQWWADNLASNITYGQDWVDLTDTLPGNTYKAAEYFAVNIIWLPVERMGLGLEFLYGGRENKDGANGKAYRIQAGVQYRF
jgi:DcaP outer membrane protein